jgi:hypothetical protein
MEEQLIAPCGMNCALCVSYLAMKNDINKEGFHRRYCPGCIPRGKHCLFMKDQCAKVGKGQVRFCSECDDFPCKRLKTLDARYRAKYHMSMIENLAFIQKHGMDAFLQKEEDAWRCGQCGQTICCHNGICLHCNLEKMKQNKKYRWDEK